MLCSVIEARTPGSMPFLKRRGNRHVLPVTIAANRKNPTILGTRVGHALTDYTALEVKKIGEPVCSVVGAGS
jgi:hypothetical protein